MAGFLRLGEVTLCGCDRATVREDIDDGNAVKFESRNSAIGAFQKDGSRTNSAASDSLAGCNGDVVQGSNWVDAERVTVEIKISSNAEAIVAIGPTDVLQTPCVANAVTLTNQVQQTGERKLPDGRVARLASPVEGSSIASSNVDCRLGFANDSRALSPTAAVPVPSLAQDPR